MVATVFIVVAVVLVVDEQVCGESTLKCTFRLSDAFPRFVFLAIAFIGVGIVVVKVVLVWQLVQFRLVCLTWSKDPAQPWW